MTIPPLRERPAFDALAKHHSELVGRHLRELFAEDPARGERLCAEAAGLYLDYSKNRITDETLGLLLQLAEQSGLEQHRDAMFAGERINVSENRSVLHVALRMPKGTLAGRRRDRRGGRGARGPRPDGRVRHRIRSGEWKGHTGKRDPQHRQHRHRRVRPGAGDGLRGAAPLQPTAT